MPYRTLRRLAIFAILAFPTLLLAGDVERSYLVSVPECIHSPALIVILHGHGGTAEGAIGMLGQPENTVIVAPQGVNNSWNAGHCCGYAFENKIDDLGFLEELIDRLVCEYGVNRDRVFVLGFSNGGMLAHKLAGRSAHRLAAIAVISGTIGGKASASGETIVPETPSESISVFMAHGKNDNIVQFDQDWSLPADRYDVSFADGVAFWRHACGYDRTARTPNNSDYETAAYVPSSPDPEKPRGLLTMVFAHGGHEAGDWELLRERVLMFFALHPKSRAANRIEARSWKRK